MSIRTDGEPATGADSVNEEARRKIQTRREAVKFQCHPPLRTMFKDALPVDPRRWPHVIRDARFTDYGGCRVANNVDQTGFDGSGEARGIHLLIGRPIRMYR